ncbi:SDR family oxidoreductase [Lacticaseibacillus zhaodongensis]|uniref:SDR family oxidoreductase n=1 Tax=Lacticaseibacillus zhaodongensis TaxID=2668065 RepID=UPI0012D31957|nr:SDR family oxidoreductase [Lacticaseibacillus zhaodongensis]
MRATILVLGADGNIGRPLVQELLKTGKHIVAGAHNPLHVPEQFKTEPLIDVRRFDFLNAATFAPALAGVDQVFFVRPPQLSKPKQDMFPFLDAVKAAHVQQTVFVSMIGVEKNVVTPHHKIEKYIEKIGLPHTFIRPSFFMQNLSTTHLADIRDRHDLFIPAGNALTSFIDARDIAAVAAKALLDPKQYLGQKLAITGGTAISYEQAAAIMTNVLGVKFTYTHPGLLQFRRTMLKRGIKKDFVNVMVMLYVITRMGNAKTVTDTVQKVLGRAPISFAQFVADNADVFLGKTDQAK